MTSMRRRFKLDQRFEGWQRYKHRCHGCGCSVTAWKARSWPLRLWCEGCGQLMAVEARRWEDPGGVAVPSWATMAAEPLSPIAGRGEAAQPGTLQSG